MERSKTFIRNTRRYLCAVSLFEHAALWVIIAWGLFLLWGICDYLAPLSLTVRRIYFYVSAGAGIALLCRFFVANAPPNLSDRRIILRIQNAFPGLSDELLSAWQLRHGTVRGISGELIARLADGVETKIAALSFWQVLPPGAKLRRVAGASGVLFCISASLYFLPPFVIRPSMERVRGSLSHSAWNTYFTVVPCSGKYPRGSAVDITVKRARPFAGEPALRIRSAGSQGEVWRREEMKSLSSGEYGYRIEQLTTALEYTISWSDWITPIFSLKPLAYAQAGDFTVRYRCPAYTGLPVQTVQGTPNLSGLAGTRVQVNARCSGKVRKAVAVTDQGLTYPVEIGADGISWQMVLKKSGTYRLLLEDEDGMSDPEPPVYDIAVIADRVPSVEIVSPKDDLFVSPGAELPLVIRADDDFGIASLELVFQKGDSGAARVAVDRGRRPVGGIYEYVWPLEELHLNPGERVRYYVEARDNDSISGPKTAATPALTLEAADYEKEHDRIEADLKDVRRELLNILADQTLAREKLKSLQVAFSTNTYTGVVKNQRDIRSATVTPAERLRGILRRMEADPCTDFATHSEYKSLAANLDHLAGGPMNEAVAALEKKDWEQSQKIQDEIIAELEKMTLLSEDIWQYQRMRDLLDKSAELGKAGRALAQGSQPEDLRKALSEVRGLLAKVSQQLAGMPQELPEDFVNAPAVKKIDMQSAQRMTDALEQALAAGDWTRARELALSLAKQLESMAKTLDAAGQDVGFSRTRSGALASDLERRKSELEGIVKRQENLLRQTEEMDGNRRKAMFRSQEGLLAGLETKQAELIGRAGKMQQRITLKQPVLGWSAGQSIDLMRRVLDEFRQRRVYHSQKYLEDIIRQIDDIRKEIDARKESFGAAGYAVVQPEVTGVGAGESDILEALRRKTEEKLFDRSDEERLAGLSRNQRALKDDTGRLRKSLEEFTRKSASLDPRVFDGMDKAASAMDAAGGELAAGDTPRAMESGRLALQNLEQSMQGMASSLDGMGQEGKMCGTPSGSPAQMRVGDGSKGLRSQPVKLPRADEYKPPQEFRQEIMDALKEKYPLQYEKIIKEYFRRLTE